MKMYYLIKMEVKLLKNIIVFHLILTIIIQIIRNNFNSPFTDYYYVKIKATGHYNNKLYELRHT
jgi:hypothetical protein